MNVDPARLEIRRYLPGDAATTLTIFTTSITHTAAGDYSPEQTQAWAQPGERDPGAWNDSMTGRSSFVAIWDGQVVGFSDVTDRGYIEMLFVAPEHLGCGIARALLREAERRARERDASALTADVSITARRFFERHGFSVERRQEPVRRGVRLVNFRMRKSLRKTRV